MPLNIVFSGLGAMGGYYGAHVASVAESLQSVSVHFFMRNNNHGETTKRNGLHVTSPSLDFYAHPSSVCYEAKDLPHADLLVLGTKGYDTLSNIQQLSPIITEKTIFFTTQNGLLIPEEIKRLYPRNLIVAGACHITGRRSQPGLIEIRSDRNMLKFGPYLLKNDIVTDQQQCVFEMFYLLLKSAGVHCKLFPEAHQLLCDKFVMLSPSAVATTYFDEPIGIVMEQHSHDLKALIGELLAIYRAMNAPTECDDVEYVYDLIDKMPKEATTSMHSDIINGNTSELELLVGYVVNKGQELSVPTPKYALFYDKIRQRISQRSES